MKSAEWEQDIQERLGRIENSRREFFSQIKVSKLNFYHIQIVFARDKIWRENLEIAKKDLTSFVNENEKK